MITTFAAPKYSPQAPSTVENNCYANLGLTIADIKFTYKDRIVVLVKVRKGN